MKTKTILSSIVLLTFALLGGGSFEGFETLLWIAGIAFVIILIFAIIENNKNEEKKKQEREKQRQLRNAQIEQYNKDYETFVSVNGVPDKKISLSEYNMNSDIYVYENRKLIYIYGDQYEFKSIMGCQFVDTPTIKKGEMTAESKTSTGSMIGRSIAGDIIAGPAGAVIGGATAKKNTVIRQADDKTIHDYTVVINIDSISKPIIRIHTGDNGTLTNEIVGLMNVIISRK